MPQKKTPGRARRAKRPMPIAQVMEPGRVEMEQMRPEAPRPAVAIGIRRPGMAVPFLPETARAAAKKTRRGAASAYRAGKAPLAEKKPPPRKKAPPSGKGGRVGRAPGRSRRPRSRK